MSNKNSRSVIRTMPRYFTKCILLYDFIEFLFLIKFSILHHFYANTKLFNTSILSCQGMIQSLLKFYIINILNIKLEFLKYCSNKFLSRPTTYGFVPLTVCIYELKKYFLSMYNTKYSEITVFSENIQKTIVECQLEFILTAKLSIVFVDQCCNFHHSDDTGK